MTSDKNTIGEQLSLFQDEYVLFNSALLELTKLNLEEAKKAFQHYKDLYPRSGRGDSEIKLADFLIKGFLEAPDACPDEPAFLYGLWKSFETYVQSVEYQSERIVSDIKNSFFQKIINAVDQCNLADEPYLSENIPMGYVYIHAGKYDKATTSLQACILESPDNPAIYGYLGDAYMLRDEQDVSRKCYMEACLIDPAGIDWKHMKDHALFELRDQLVEEYDMDNSLASEWLPSYAYIQGLFKPKTIRLNAGLKEFVDEYLGLRKTYLEEQTSILKAKLFIRAIILCDNESFLKFVKKIDFVDIRKQMKEINPALFSKYLRHIEGRNRRKG